MLKLIAYCLVFVVFSFDAHAQNTAAASDELFFSVETVYPYISIAKEDLAQAARVSDLKDATNRLPLEYKCSWVSEYISLEVSAIRNGKLKKAINHNNDTLSDEQKDLMLGADAGTEISIAIEYLPKNNLKKNDHHKINFSFSVTPDKMATYAAGQDEMNAYLKEKAIDLIPRASFQDYDMAAIKFTIDTDGKVIHPHLFGPEYNAYPNEENIAMLIKAVSNMPCWSPARYADGTIVPQDFVLTVGNPENCVANLLNVERERDDY